MPNYDLNGNPVDDVGTPSPPPPQQQYDLAGNPVIVEQPGPYPQQPSPPPEPYGQTIRPMQSPYGQPPGRQQAPYAQPPIQQTPPGFAPPMQQAPPGYPPQQMPGAYPPSYPTAPPQQRAPLTYRDASGQIRFTNEPETSPREKATHLAVGLTSALILGIGGAVACMKLVEAIGYLPVSRVFFLFNMAIGAIVGGCARYAAMKGGPTALLIGLPILALSYLIGHIVFAADMPARLGMDVSFMEAMAHLKLTHWLGIVVGFAICAKIASTHSD